MPAHWDRPSFASHLFEGAFFMCAWIAYIEMVSGRAKLQLLSQHRFHLLVQNIPLSLPIHLLHCRRFLPSPGDNPASAPSSSLAGLSYGMFTALISFLCLSQGFSDYFSLCFSAAAYRQLAIWLALIWRRRRHAYLQWNNFPLKKSLSTFMFVLSWAENIQEEGRRDENGVAWIHSLPSCPLQNPKLILATEVEFSLWFLHLGRHDEVESTCLLTQHDRAGRRSASTDSWVCFGW